MGTSFNPRIALIADWSLPRLGGLEIYLHDLAAALRAAGADVDIITPMPGPEEMDGVRIHRLCDMQRPGGDYLFAPGLSADNSADFLYYLELLFRPRRLSPWQRLRTLMRNGGYDVAHVHLGNTPFTFAATNICLNAGMPTVSTFHSLLGPAEVPIARILSHIMECATWPGKVHLTAVSSKVAETRAPMLGHAQLDILPHGIDVEYWQGFRKNLPNVSSGHLPRQIEFVAPTRLHARRNPTSLLAAMRTLKSHLPEHVKVCLRIAGDGPLRDAMQTTIARDGLSDCVQLCGKLSRDQLGDLLAQADLVLLPTHIESFGISALEARAVGVPAIVMKSSAATDFLTPDVDCLVAVDDRDFAKALIRYMDNPMLRDRLKTGAMRPLEGYSKTALVERCLAIYRRAME